MCAALLRQYFELWVLRSLLDVATKYPAVAMVRCAVLSLFSSLHRTSSVSSKGAKLLCDDLPHLTQPFDADVVADEDGSVWRNQGRIERNRRGHIQWRRIARKLRVRWVRNVPRIRHVRRKHASCSIVLDDVRRAVRRHEDDEDDEKQRSKHERRGQRRLHGRNGGATVMC